MEFRTENGTQIPISGLDDSLAITVAINNGTGGELGTDPSVAGGVPTAGAVNISQCDSVIVRVITGNNNRQAGLFVQLNFTSLEGHCSLLYILTMSKRAHVHCISVRETERSMPLFCPKNAVCKCFYVTGEPF